jgi:hypothetical protein
VSQTGSEARHHHKNGRSYLVLMSAEDLESIEATLELLTDAEAVRRVEQAVRTWPSAAAPRQRRWPS